MLTKRQSFYTFAPLVTFAYMLSACHERPVVVLPPPELATCADEPKPPVLPDRDGTEAVQLQRDTMTLDYILALVGAGGDCRAKVAGLRIWRERM